MVSYRYTEEELEILKYECFVEGFEDGLGKHDERNGKYEYICYMNDNNKFKKIIYDLFIKEYIDEHIKDYYDGNEYEERIKEMYEDYPFNLNKE